MELLPERNLLLEIIVDYHDQLNLIADKSNERRMGKKEVKRQEMPALRAAMPWRIGMLSG
jgi:hypothetical protein